MVQTTRITNVLDIVLTTAPERVSAISITDGFSDHSLLEFTVCTPSCTRNLTTKRIFDYKRADYNAINRDLESFSPRFLATFFQRSVNKNWCLFKEQLLGLANKYIPQISFRTNCSKPWFNKTLNALKNKKKRLYRAAKSVNTLESWNKHKACEKAYCSSLRHAKHKFFSDDLQSLIKNNPKKFWKTISPSNSTDTPALVDSTGLPIPREHCASVLNNYFISTFTKEDHSNMPKMADLDYQYMTPITVTATGIATLINNLKLSTSSGFDGINTKILKHTVVPSSTILSHIFQQSLSTGELPNDWKVGKIIPVFKSGDPST